MIGRTNGLFGDDPQGQFTSASGRDLASFDISGFTVGEPENSSSTNNNGESLVAWCWKAGGSSNTFNVDGTGYASASAAGITDGSIALTGASVNTEAGFSILTWTGTGSAGTIAHGLGASPKIVVVKRRSGSDHWQVYWIGAGTERSGFLSLENALSTGATTSYWGTSEPTSTVFSVGSATQTNASSETYVGYCWTEIPGYSKFGEYTGNGSSDGVVVELGFRPAWVLVKRTNQAASWSLHDNKRAGYNSDNDYLHPDLSQAESDGSPGTVDLLSNGFKCTTTAGTHNNSGGNFIYMALAAQPGPTPFDTFANSR